MRMHSPFLSKITRCLQVSTKGCHNFIRLRLTRLLTTNCPARRKGSARLPCNVGCVSDKKSTRLRSKVQQMVQRGRISRHVNGEKTLGNHKAEGDLKTRTFVFEISCCSRESSWSFTRYHHNLANVHCAFQRCTLTQRCTLMAHQARNSATKEERIQSDVPRELIRGCHGNVKDIYICLRSYGGVQRVYIHWNMVSA